MFNFVSICLLMAGTTSAQSQPVDDGYTRGWPLYEVNTLDKVYSDYTDTEVQTLGPTPYACLKTGFRIFTRDAAGLPFAYTTNPTWLASSSQDASTAVAADDDFACCSGSSSCSAVFDAPSDWTRYQVYDTSGPFGEPMANPEFLLAAIYQPAPASPRATATNYCDT